MIRNKEKGKITLLVLKFEIIKKKRKNQEGQVWLSSDRSDGRQANQEDQYIIMK